MESRHVLILAEALAIGLTAGVLGMLLLHLVVHALFWLAMLVPPIKRFVEAYRFNLFLKELREGEYSLRVGGHHDSVTGEFHGMTFYFHQEAVLTWYADCPKCVADRDSHLVENDSGWDDPYKCVRVKQSEPVPAAEMKADQEPQPPANEEVQ